MKKDENKTNAIKPRKPKARPEQKTIDARIAKKKIELIEQLKKNYGVVSIACSNIGIRRETYYAWIKDDDKFREEAEATRNLHIVLAENKLLEKLVLGDTTATIFLLKSRHPEYRPKRELSFDDTPKINAVLDNLANLFESKPDKQNDKPQS